MIKLDESFETQTVLAVVPLPSSGSEPSPTTSTSPSGPNGGTGTPGSHDKGAAGMRVDSGLVGSVGVMIMGAVMGAVVLLA